MIAIERSDRLLVVAPHPDDELIAAGLLLQEALAVGAAVHVLIVTHGDAFGYSALPVTAGREPRFKRINLGLRRSRESLQALARIGVPSSCITFLGYPDRGLFKLWTDHWKRADCYHSPFTLVDSCPYEGVFTPDAPYAGEQLLYDLTRVLQQFQPTVLVYPHPRDAHYDHAACSAFVTKALEDRAREGHAWAGLCRRYTYLVHRGGWPSPRGYNPKRVHRPPVGMVPLQEDWVEIWGDPGRVAQKHEAITMYRSQFPLIGRFLLSFIGRNELFARPSYPRLEKIQTGSLCLGTAWAPWPPRPIVVDPIQDSLTRQVERSADIASVRAVRDDAFLMVQIGLSRRPVPEVDYDVSLFPGSPNEAVHLRVRPPGRVTRRIAGVWQPQKEIVVRVRDSFLEIAMPAPLPDRAGGFFVNVATRYRGLRVDRTGLHYIQFDPAPWAEEGIVYAVATPADVATCAAIFTESYKKYDHHMFDTIPPFRLVRQFFRLCYEYEPGCLIVALSGGRVIGYVCAPASLRLVLLDKFDFIRPVVRRGSVVEPLILSAAVVPGARAQGVGTRLIRHAMQRFAHLGVDQVHLEVRPWNEPAVRIVTHLGFQTVGRLQDGVGDWMVMHAKL